MMKIFGLHILTKSDLATIKQDAAAFALTEADKFVATLKGTPVGAAAVTSINAVENKSLSGLQKFEQVVEAVFPLVINYASSGGVTLAIDTAKDLARQFVQSTFNDLKNSKVVSDLVSALHL